MLDYTKFAGKKLGSRARLNVLGVNGRAGAAPLAEINGFGSNPGALRMWIYRPENLRRPAPLVVALHGCTQSASVYNHGTGWSTLAERFGFMVLLPEQQQSNNPNRCFNWFESADNHRDRGEALSIAQMVSFLIEEGAVEPDSVFVTGLSAGGAMSAVLLAAYPEMFSAGAVIAGLPYGSANTMHDAFKAMAHPALLTSQDWGSRVRTASAHRGTWPRVSIWHGGADTTVSADNAEALVLQWTDLHGLERRPAVEEVVSGHRHRVWKNADGVALVEDYRINGMGHGVPLDTQASRMRSRSTGRVSS